MRKYIVSFVMECSDEGELPDITPDEMLGRDNEDGEVLGSYSIGEVVVKQIKVKEEGIKKAHNIRISQKNEYLIRKYGKDYSLNDMDSSFDKRIYGDVKAQ